MRTFTTLLPAIALFGSLTSAHMAMSDPPPIKHASNPFSDGQVDFDYVSPLSADGSNFPCKGYHSLLDSPQGQPVAKWTAGQSYSLTIAGGAIHGGGSCQASISHDGGRTFKVIHSYVGNCPSSPGETSYDFTLPAETPDSDRAIFAWSWFNNLGNREMYMDCAVVSVSGGGRGLDARPDLFTANIGNGCGTVDSQDLAFPNPGPDVSGQNANAAPPTGTCEGGNGAPASPGAQEGTTPPDAQEGNAPPNSQETPTAPGAGEGAGRESAGHAPGNDWPVWYNGADRYIPNLTDAIILQLGMIPIHYLVRWWMM